jgi:hypothetical protein
MVMDVIVDFEGCPEHSLDCLFLFCRLHRVWIHCSQLRWFVLNWRAIFNVVWIYSVGRIAAHQREKGGVCYQGLHLCVHLGFGGDGLGFHRRGGHRSCPPCLIFLMLPLILFLLALLVPQLFRLFLLLRFSLDLLLESSLCLLLVRLLSSSVVLSRRPIRS